MIKIPVPVEPGQTESEYIGKCVRIEMENGYPQKQAIAMCYSMWRKAKGIKQPKKSKNQIE